MAALTQKIPKNIHPALVKARVRTQFNGPNPPPRCAKEGCNGWAWRKSPGGFCWHHAGNAKKHLKRRSASGERKRALNRHRAEQKDRAQKLNLSRDAHDLVAQYCNSILPHDIYTLRIAAYELIDEHCIDSRTFHAIIGELRTRQQFDVDYRAENNSPRPKPKEPKPSPQGTP